MKSDFILIILSEFNELILVSTILFVPGPAVTVMAVLNGTASLPCSIIPPTPSDSVILVVWYRNELKPIYR